MSIPDHNLSKWDSKGVFISSILLFFISLVGLSFFTERENFGLLLSLSLISFLVLTYWLQSARLSEERVIWVLSVVARLVFLFSIPALSDDYFRFIWDGKLLNMDQNPFAFLPEHFKDLDGMKNVYEGLNSKPYYSVYPPVMQFCFWLSAWIGGGSIWSNVVVLKLLLMFADFGVIYFAIKILKMLKMNIQNVLIYALNPLVILEVVGNLHFEAMMMFFTLMAIYLIIKKGDNVQFLMLAAFVFSLGVSTKLVSLLFVPAFLRWIGWRRFLIFGGILGLSLVLQFIPFINSQVISNFSQSLDLYFRSFEFNASIYFAANYIYAQFVGWEEIVYVGPAIALAGAFLMLFFSWERKVLSWENYFEIVLLVLTIHLLFSTTVHPWYLINLLVVSVFTRYKFVVLWSFLIIITYFFYIDLKIPWYFLAFEYVAMMGYVVYELWYHKKRKNALTF